ncbi:hypothetical protein D9Q98_007151 [Chlorella vulgaris]|uniref:Uncharacterized protein n=1 Tax=Chlorella vulgaris TaxID=3077 RepID=A0A9D4TJQ4_CHLVU|nr:hypothetical protein D9Q98_007151 [Chlorella vulgaris]
MESEPGWLVSGRSFKGSWSSSKPPVLQTPLRSLAKVEAAAVSSNAETTTKVRQLAQLQERQRQLEWQVEEERQRRQQVEQDFQLLLSSMDAQHVSPPSPGSPAAPLPQHQAQAMQLQAAVSTLQHVAHGLSSIGGEASIEAW